MNDFDIKRNLSKKINKIEEKRATDIQKLEAKEVNADSGDLESIAAKKQKNMEKMMKY